MAFRILLVGGGSGGHVYPLMAVAQALRKKAQALDKKVDFLAIGEGGFLERAAKEQDIRYKYIVAGKLRRYISPLIVLDLIKIPVGFLQALWQLFWYMPEVVFSKGGYDTVAPILVAKLYGIPVYIHESDSVPGLANTFVSRFAKKVFISFQSAAQFFSVTKTVLVGNPIRSEVLNGEPAAAMSFFKLDPQKKTVLIIGGSQGAKQINEVVLASLVVMVKEFQIIHQCGDTQIQSVQAEVDRITKEGEDSYANDIKANYRVYPFFSTPELAMAYAAADLIVSRAGSGSIFEIAAVAKPAVLIPLESAAKNHQVINAAETASKTGCVVVEGANMTTNVLLSQIHNLMEPAIYTEVSGRLKAFAKLDAADKIAEAILS